MTREHLEMLQDRPSLHSDNPTDRTLGRFQAVIDQHIQDAHPGVGSLTLHRFCCEICGFNAQLEFLRLYPEERLGPGTPIIGSEPGPSLP